MRLEKTDRQDRKEYKVWLNNNDFKQLVTYSPTTKHELIIRLCGKCGLRSHEVPQIKPNNYYESTEKKGEYLLKVPKGKDTTGSGGKFRTTYLPKSLWSDLGKYRNENNISNKDPFFPYSPRHIRRLIKQVAKNTAKKTGNENFNEVSSHALRRFFAHYNLVEKGKNPKVIQKLGGWSDYQAIEPYLNEPSEGHIIDTMKED